MGSRKRPPLDKSKSESNKLDIDDQMLKLFLGEANIKGSRITLPLMESLVLNPTIPTPPAANSSSVAVVPVPKAAAEPLPIPSVVLKGPDPEDMPEANGTIIAPAPNISIPIYTGYLHERASWKFGPRWNRFKCTLYPKLLVVGSHSLKIGKDDFRIALAAEVHSRPFAFKLEQCRASQGKWS